MSALRVAAAYHRHEPVSDVALASLQNVVIERLGQGFDPDFVFAPHTVRCGFTNRPPVPSGMVGKLGSAAYVVGQFTDVLLDEVTPQYPIDAGRTTFNQNRARPFTWARSVSS